MTSNKTDHDSPSEENINGSESDWGADWEEAFQAEEDAMFSFEEGEYPDLFKQKNKPQKAAEQRQAGDMATPADDAKATEAGPSFTTQLAGLLRTTGQEIVALIKKPYTSPNLLPRLAAYGLPVFICVLFLYPVLKPTTSEPPVTGGPASLGKVPAGPLGTLEKNDLTEPSNTQPNKEAPPATGLLPSEKVRNKWKFATFMIPSAPDEDESKISFVIIDLTLVTLYEAQTPLPEEKKIFARDIIYQFFANQPLYELRRFSLARGEMERKLKAWVQKQWPELPLESIIFEKYQIS